MICPNCKTKYPIGNKFCSACEDENGMPIRLVEEQQTAGDVNLEIGDANAISGGINVSDSHNVHNENKSVHNINQVTNNITQFAAQKTEMEILQEKKKTYREACVVAFVDDYKIDAVESLALDKLRMELGLEKDIAESILHEVKNVYGQQARQTHLNPIAQKKLDIFSENLKKNNVDVLREQIGSMEALVNRFEHEELTRKYFLVLAALMPEKCISMKEASKTDSYWKSYWSYLAYLKKGNINMAESVLMNLDRFADYPEDNTSLLAVAGALMTGNIVDAKSYLETVTGEFSPELRFFADSIFKCLDPEMVQVEDETVLRFYLANFFKDNCTQEGTPQECTMPYSFDDDHGTFTGLAIDGIPVKGVFKGDDGATFEGEFKDGAPYKGILSVPGLATFEGELSKDGFYKGIATDPNGGTFEGEFKGNGPYNGIISDFVMDDGDTLTGRLVNGQLEGYAKVCHKDGSRFEGEVKKGEPYNGKLFDMVMDDGQKKDVVLSEGKICIDQEEREEQRRKEKEKRKAEEDARKKAEAKRRAEERARQKAEEAARKKAEEEARRKRKEKELVRKKAEQEAKHKAEEEARRKAAEEARRKEEEERKREEAEEAKAKADHRSELPPELCELIEDCEFLSKLKCEVRPEICKFIEQSEAYVAKTIAKEKKKYEEPPVCTALDVSTDGHKKIFVDVTLNHSNDYDLELKVSEDRTRYPDRLQPNKYRFVLETYQIDGTSANGEDSKHTFFIQHNLGYSKRCPLAKIDVTLNCKFNIFSKNVIIVKDYKWSRTGASNIEKTETASASQTEDLQKLLNAVLGDLL